MLIKKLNDALAANLYVSEEDVQRAYRDQVERAKIRYIQVPRARFTAQASATPDEVSAYYQAHKQEFSLPEQRDIAYLLVNGYQLADQVKVSDQDLRSYYDAHKAEYSQEEQVKARHILVAVNDQRNDAQAQARVAEVKKKPGVYTYASAGPGSTTHVSGLLFLKNAGLVTERREGTRRYYRARPEGLADVRAFLDDFWDDKLVSLKREVERG